jgi:hypothetical protein
MWEILKLHETFIGEALVGKHGEVSFAELKAFHERQLAAMQHERLIHLIVTMFVTTFTLLTIGFAMFVVQWLVLVMALILLGLTSAYLAHYFRLENGVQRLYELTNRIDQRLGVVSARYAGHRITPWNSKA